MEVQLLSADINLRYRFSAQLIFGRIKVREGFNHDRLARGSGIEERGMQDGI